MRRVKVQLTQHTHTWVEAPDLPPKKIVHELIPGILDPIADLEQDPLPTEYPFCPKQKERHIEAFQDILTTSIPGCLSAKGDGIVYVGGGRWWPMVVVALRMAREVTNLPIQVWYRGTEEPINPLDVADLPNITFHDTTKFSARICRGWEAKQIALLHCGFEKALYLDADACLISDPTPLFHMSSSDKPLLFWQDLHSQQNSIHWEWTGVEGPNGVQPIQGGQYLIHRPTWWRILVLTHWICQHSDYFFKHLFGDQDAMRLVMAAVGNKSVPIGMVEWKSPAYHCSLPDKKEPLIIHRSGHKMWGDPNQPQTTHIPKDRQAWRHMDQHLARQEVRSLSFGEWRSYRLQKLQTESRYGNDEQSYNKVKGLLDLIAYTKCQQVVELGSHRGVSTEVFLLNCRKVIAVDNWLNAEQHFQAFLERCKDYPNLSIMRTYTIHAASFVDDKSLDLVYIDAGHEYKEVKEEILVWERKIRVGGYIAGHDYFHQCPGVIQAVNERYKQPQKVFEDSSWIVKIPHSHC